MKMCNSNINMFHLMVIASETSKINMSIRELQNDVCDLCGKCSISLAWQTK